MKVNLSPSLNFPSFVDFNKIRVALGKEQVEYAQYTRLFRHAVQRRQANQLWDPRIEGWFTIESGTICNDPYKTNLIDTSDMSDSTDVRWDKETQTFKAVSGAVAEPLSTGPINKLIPVDGMDEEKPLPPEKSNVLVIKKGDLPGLLQAPSLHANTDSSCTGASENPLEGLPEPMCVLPLYDGSGPVNDLSRGCG